MRRHPAGTPKGGRFAPQAVAAMPAAAGPIGPARAAACSLPTTHSGWAETGGTKGALKAVIGDGQGSSAKCVIRPVGSFYEWWVRDEHDMLDAVRGCVDTVEEARESAEAAVAGVCGRMRQAARLPKVEYLEAMLRHKYAGWGWDSYMREAMRHFFAAADPPLTVPRSPVRGRGLGQWLAEEVSIYDRRRMARMLHDLHLEELLPPGAARPIRAALSGGIGRAAPARGGGPPGVRSSGTAAASDKGAPCHA